MRMARKFPCVAAIGLVGLLTACSDPVPPAAQGSVSLHLATAVDMTQTCVPGPHWVNAPDAPQGGQQTNAQSAGKRAVDGDSGAKVACKVKQDGDKFTVSGDITVPASDVTGRQLPSETSLNLDVKIAAKEEGAIGSVRVFDDKTQSVYSSATCSFSVNPKAPGDQLAIFPGRVWGNVKCTNLSDPSNPAKAACDVDIGYFVFENCDQ